MTQKSQEALTKFMTKQASKKLQSQNNVKKSHLNSTKNGENKNKKDEKEQENQEEMSDEEKLAEAKKESQAKLENVDRTGMYKKLFLEAISKYVLLIALLVTIAFAIITLAPAFFEFLHGLFLRMLLGGAK